MQLRWCILLGDDRFEWDEANANHIWDEHRVSVGEAEEAFDDPGRVTRGSNVRTERRVVVVGRTYNGRILTVIVTFRSGLVRVVTAREANKWEKQHYRARKHR